MRKWFYLLAFLLLSCTAFAQSKMPFTSLKPFNKGNFKIDVSYSKLQQTHPSFNYPDFRVGVSYGITNWCLVGVFGSYGKDEGLMFVGGGWTVQGTDSIYHPVVYEGKHIEHYYHYGIDAELHPLSLLLPNFYFVDVYCRGELGMRTVWDQYIPKYEDAYKPIFNNFLIGGSIGIVINPSKYFGVFYEMGYDNLNKQAADYYAERKPKSYYRYGLNIRFGGPKKWQR